MRTPRIWLIDHIANHYLSSVDYSCTMLMSTLVPALVRL